jgi:hypothetical protein
VKAEWAAVAAFYMRRVAHRRGEPGVPGMLARLLRTSDKHRLTEMIALTLLYLDDRGAGAATPGACIADPDLLSTLREMAR